MGNMNRFRNSVIRHWDFEKGSLYSTAKEGLAALRDHRSTNKASGKSRKSGLRRRLPEWLRFFLYGSREKG